MNLDEMTGWQYRVTEAYTNPFFVMEVIFEGEIVPPFMKAIEVVDRGLKGLEAALTPFYKAWHEAYEQKRIRQAKDVTPRKRDRLRV